MFGGVFKITHLTAEKAFSFSVPSPTNVDYTDAISVKFTNGATGSFSGEGDTLLFLFWRAGFLSVEGVTSSRSASERGLSLSLPSPLE